MPVKIVEQGDVTLKVKSLNGDGFELRLVAADREDKPSGRRSLKCGKFYLVGWADASTVLLCTQTSLTRSSSPNSCPREV
jgi:hypothetical protein